MLLLLLQGLCKQGRPPWKEVFVLIRILLCPPRVGGSQQACSMTTVDWEHRVGPSAGAAMAGSTLLDHNLSYAECLAACAAAGDSCPAVDYVLKHIKPSAALTSTYPSCKNTKQPMRRSCYAVSTDAWHRPCMQPQTENAGALKLLKTRAAPQGAKNVLLAIFDDLRVVDGRLSPHVTPATRRFASQATAFLSAHAQTALCAPSRASFLSGRRPDLTRVHWTDTHLRTRPSAQEWVTLPQHFSNHGYYVAAAGKMFHKTADPASLDPRSWSEPESIVAYPYFGQGECPEKPEVLLHVFNTTSGCPVDAARHPRYVFTDEQVLRKALTLLRTAAPAARERRRPFWLGVGFFKPHKPHVFPAELLSRVPALAEVPLALNGHPATRMAPMANIAELCTADGKAAPESEAGHRCARENIRMYHAAAAFTDGLLSKLLLELEAQRLHEETLVVVMGDHGFALGEHGSWAKWTNWEVATRTPLFIRAPWLPGSAGVQVATPVELLDLFPTVADLAGVPLPVRPRPDSYKGIDGRSLAQLMERRPISTADSAHDGGVAFSQIARCWQVGRPRNSSSYAAMAQCDGVPSEEYAFMGYSIRSAVARYTEWVPTRWDSTTARHVPQWSRVADRELYAHVPSDDLADVGWAAHSENINIESERPAEVTMLQHRLRIHFDRTLAEAATL